MSWIGVKGWGTMLVLAVLAGAGALHAQSSRRGGGLKMRTGPDGVPVITNESTAQHALRVAERRVPVPDERIHRLILRYSAQRQLDPRLVQAVIQAESGYNARALSNRGAMGLMQLMPATAAELRITDPYDPEENIRGGTAYLSRLLDHFGRLEVALAAYNAGPTAVERHDGVPPYEETHSYIRRVIRLFKGEDAAVDLATPIPRGKKTYFVRRPGKRPMLTTEAPD